MGLLYADAKNLLDLRRGGKGGRVATLGRLTTYFHPADIEALRSQVGSDVEARKWLDEYEWGMVADDFFRRVLKFETVESIDYSDYQGATIIHDLSEPLPKELHRQFDLAVDGGTLEHIFNFPVAIGNLMQLVRVGGHVYANSPCNNLMGHGFYQISPELMFRIFSAQNGFEIEAVRLAEAHSHAVEITSGHKIYEVVDPDSVGSRIQLVSNRPVLIMTIAKCVEIREPFREKVLQSDYVSRWNAVDDEPNAAVGGLKTLVRDYVPQSFWNYARRIVLRRRASFGNNRHFTRVN